MVDGGWKNADRKIGYLKSHTLKEKMTKIIVYNETMKSIYVSMK